MKIKIISLTLLNFKGVKQLKVDFNPGGDTNIYGRNEAGKTTIFDAYLWLLFGKDSTDRKTFEIKTLGPDNKPYHKMEHEVTATLLVDDSEVVLSKKFVEKWTRNRGSQVEEFSGHENSFYWNAVPLKLNEYEAKIKELVDEKIFKMVSNVNYFPFLTWDERREVLTKMANLPSDKSLFTEYAGEANMDGSFLDAIIIAINEGKSVPEYRKEIAAKRKNILADKDNLPARISEARHNMPDEVDYSLIEGRIERKKKELGELEDQLFDKQKEFDAIKSQMNQNYTKLNDLKTKANNRYSELRDGVRSRISDAGSDMRKVEADIKQLQSDIYMLKSNLDQHQKSLSQVENERTVLREDWTKINDSKLEFSNDQFCCPTCKRELDPADVDSKKQELEKTFNSNKTSKLNSISSRGTGLKETAEELSKKVETLEKQIKDAETLLSDKLAELTKLKANPLPDEKEELTKAIESDANYQALANEVADFEASISNEIHQPDTAELNNRRETIKAEIQDLQQELAGKAVREQLLARIKELEEKEATLAQELATLEGIEFAIADFIRYKMNMLEESVNSKFNLVKFKLFEEQINGAEIEACTILKDGVPYADLNTASKIQAGVDIVNTLSNHYGLSAPIFIDNRESVTQIPSTENQVVSLIVSPADKKLRIESQPALVGA